MDTKSKVASVLYAAAVVGLSLGDALKKIRHISICCFSCVLFSCVSSEPPYRQTILIEQPDLQYNEYNTWFSDRFVLDRIVPIETTKDYVMTDMFGRVILYHDNIIILDHLTSSIYVVDAISGKIKTYINRKGRGPGESSRIRDIAFDDQNEQILAYNNYNKLIYFTLDGDFLKEEKITNKHYSEILYYDGNLIFYLDGIGLSCFPYLLDIYNLTDKKWKSLGTEQKVDFHGTGLNMLGKSKNIWYSPVLDMGLYLFDVENDSIKTPYTLDVKNPLTKELQKRYQEKDYRYFDRQIYERKILFRISYIRELEKHIVFSANSAGLMIIDKNTLEVQETPWIENEYLGIWRIYNYCAHIGDDNTIMFIVNSEEWLKRKPTAQNIPEHLQSQIEIVKVDENVESNPILVFFKEI